MQTSKEVGMEEKCKECKCYSCEGCDEEELACNNCKPKDDNYITWCNKYVKVNY